MLKDKDTEAGQTEQRLRAAESDRDRLVAKVQNIEETLAQTTIAAKRGAVRIDIAEKIAMHEIACTL